MSRWEKGIPCKKSNAFCDGEVFASLQGLLMGNPISSHVLCYIPLDIIKAVWPLG